MSDTETNQEEPGTPEGNQPGLDQGEPKTPEVKNVSVKEMPVAAWSLMLEVKDRHGKHSMADWLAKAIKFYAQYENRPMVDFPEDRPRPAPPVYPKSGPVDPGVTPVVVSFAEIRDTMQAAQAIAESTGTKVPKTLANHAYAVLTGQLRLARGMPPLKPRQRVIPGQTKAQIGVTA